MKPIQHITFDLETIPSQNPDKYPTPDTIKVPANYKKPESIEAYKNDKKNLEAAHEAQALSYIDGQIFSIGWMLDDEGPWSVWDNDEMELIQRFEEELLKGFEKRFPGYETLHNVTLIGHNIKKFDFPYLWLRARKYQCEKLLKIIGETYKEARLEDTMLWACGGNYRDYVSLEAACALFGLPGKGEMDGSKVYRAWKKKEYQKIADYGADDTKKTYDLACALGIIN